MTECTSDPIEAHRNGVYWEEMGDEGREHMVKFARFVAEHAIADRDILLGRLKTLAELACPDGYAEGYEDAAILSAIRERDDLKRGVEKEGEI